MLIDEAELDRAAALLRGGGLVAFPTETVYGLGANALDRLAVRRIFEVKGRPSTSPLIVHVGDDRTLRRVARDWPPLAQRLCERFWPGPLTLIVRKTAEIAAEVTAGLQTVGVRMPNHPVALELLARAGVPVAAPSANRFTEVSPTTAGHVRRGLGKQVDMVLDGGPAAVGIESTVLSVVDGLPVLLRPGMISVRELESVAGPIASAPPAQEGAAHAAPGMHVRHYAPHARLLLVDRGGALPEGRGRVLDLPEDPAGFAARLYAELHNADADGCEWIAIVRPPESPEWLAIWDRLRRATAGL